MCRMSRTGTHNALTDVPGVRVGQAGRIGGGALTGCTAVLPPPECVVAVDSRGGGPCTRDTARLDPRQASGPVDALVLSGGSVYGLAAADGVLRWLAEHRPIAGRAPVVPAAGLFDLGRGGEFHVTPDAALGARAAANASDGPIEQGVAGAGTGAVNGGLKGGIGTASEVLPDGAVVAALIAVNASGPSVDPATGLPYGLPAGLPGEFPLVAPSADALAAGLRLLADTVRERALPHPLNTVIGVVATTAALDRTQTQRLAAAGQDGLAFAVRPAHGLTEGDTLFALASGSSGPVEAVEPLLAAAARVVTRAMVHGMLAAESVTTPAGRIPAYRELFPATVR